MINKLRIQRGLWVAAVALSALTLLGLSIYITRRRAMQPVGTNRGRAMSLTDLMAANDLLSEHGDNDGQQAEMMWGAGSATSSAHHSPSGLGGAVGGYVPPIPMHEQIRA
jgi:hypothetical protein